jgi:hypothetical protein
MRLVLMRVNSRANAEAHGTFKYYRLCNPLPGSFGPRHNSKLALADFASGELVEKCICFCGGIYHFARRQWGCRIRFATTVAVMDEAKWKSNYYSLKSTC